MGNFGSKTTLHRFIYPALLGFAGILHAAVFDARDFGATGDGTTLETVALNRAVEACSKAGGGVVHVPAGRYLTGTVRLLSHVTLEIGGGAVLLGSENPDDYPDVADPWEPHGTGHPATAPLIYAEDAENITITGRGTIDGQGTIWWHRVRLNNPTKYPPGPRNDEDRAEAAKLSKDRPNLIRLVRCDDVVIERVNLINSPSWTVHPMFCKRLRIDGISIKNPARVAHNTDGINPQSCGNVQILNCRIDTGDDGITIKSGKNEAGRAMGLPCENITIANCIIQNAHGGITIGSEMSGGVRNVTVTNCVFQGTDNGIRLKTERGRGGVVEGIVVSNIVMQDVPNPFHMTMFYSKSADRFRAEPVTGTTPVFRDMLFSNITARAAKTAGHIFGLAESPVEDVTFSNVHMDAAEGFEITHARGITFLDSVIAVESGPALVLKNTADVDQKRLIKREATL
jgi:polygalacturonase